MSKRTTLKDEIEQTRPFRSAEAEAYLNVVRTHAVLADRFNRLFRSEGLSQPKYNALRILMGAGSEAMSVQFRASGKLGDLLQHFRKEYLGGLLPQDLDKDVTILVVEGTLESSEDSQRLKEKIVEVIQNE